MLCIVYLLYYVNKLQEKKEKNEMQMLIEHSFSTGSNLPQLHKKPINFHNDVRTRIYESKLESFQHTIKINEI